MRKLAFIFLVLLLALPACKRDYAVGQLHLADRLIEERPDSSLAILCSIDTAALPKQEQKAYWALLRTLAQINAGQVPDSTAVIDIAAAYYAGHAPDFDFMRSLYCKSRILQERGECYSAIKAALGAYELSMEQGDSCWNTRTAGQIASVFELLRSRIDTVGDASAAAYQALANGNLAAGDFAKAAAYADSMLLCQASEANFELALSLMAGERDYFIKKSRREIYKSRFLTYTSINAFVVAFLILFVSIGARKYRAKITNLRIEKMISEAQALERELGELDLDNRKLAAINQEHDKTIGRLEEENSLLSNEVRQSVALKQKVADMFKEHCARIDFLCEKYYETDSPHKVLIRQIESEVEELKKKENIVKFVDFVNKCLDGVIDKMKSQVPSLTLDNLHFVGLILAGLSVRSISYITGKNADYIYIKKKRIIDKIKNSGSPDAEAFVKMLKR